MRSSWQNTWRQNPDSKHSCNHCKRDFISEMTDAIHQAMVRYKYRLLFCFILLFDLCACSNDHEAEQSSAQGNNQDWQTVSLPDISHQPIKLRVARVLNPRFAQLSDDNIRQLLQRTQQLVKQHFDIDVEFSQITTLPVEDVFAAINPQLITARSAGIVSLDVIDDNAREAMQQAVFATLSNYSGNKQNVIDYAQPYLLHPEIEQNDFIGLSYALVDTLISRLSYWKTQIAADGKPVLDSNVFHQWVWWDSLGYSNLSYDVLITNQLVASAEYYGMDVHSSIRGGLTAGTTSFNKNTPFSAFVYIMLYPMLNNSEMMTMLRQDENYDDEQIINYSAALLTHELGHLLLHLGHPFGNKHCIMSPTIMLNYRDWYDHLDAGLCAIGSSPAMTPGAAKIDYNRRW